MRIVRRIVLVFALLIMGVAFGLLANTTSKIVSDSRPDIGLFRALGATRADIRRLFLGESALLGVFGAAAGVVLGWCLAWGISRAVIAYAHREAESPGEELLIPRSLFAIDAGFCVALLLVTILIALLAGWYPAFRASRLDPIFALKRE
jgi:putative ABC transport system permease protein